VARGNKKSCALVTVGIGNYWQTTPKELPLYLCLNCHTSLEEFSNIVAEQLIHSGHVLTNSQ